jgi:hypothetical protein
MVEWLGWWLGWLRNSQVSLGAPEAQYLKELVLANIRGDHALDLPGLLGFDLKCLELALSFFVKELSKWMFLNTTNQSDLFEHHESMKSIIWMNTTFNSRGSLMSSFFNAQSWFLIKWFEKDCTNWPTATSSQLDWIQSMWARKNHRHVNLGLIMTDQSPIESYIYLYHIQSDSDHHW